MIKFNKEKCVGCHICEIVCSMYHTKKMNPKESRIRYRDDWPHLGKVDFCRQCKAKTCVKACPVNALIVTKEGFIKVDKNKCTNCLACVKACPFGLLPNDGKYPLFCDTCNGNYECVKWCPNKALEVVGDK